MTWQPIETAKPIEFVDVVLLCRSGKPRSVSPCFWDGDKWRLLSLVTPPLEYVDPTHWMPLPEPPK